MIEHKEREIWTYGQGGERDSERRVMVPGVRLYPREHVETDPAE